MNASDASATSATQSVRYWEAKNAEIEDCCGIVTNMSKRTLSNTREMGMGVGFEGFATLRPIYSLGSAPQQPNSCKLRNPDRVTAVTAFGRLAVQVSSQVAKFTLTAHRSDHLHRLGYAKELTG